MRIDAHLHLWRIADRAGQWPPPELAAIHRDFTPADLLPLLAEAGLDGAVLVQSLPSPADTAFLLDLAAALPVVRGVVGWADLKADDAPAAIARLARAPKLKGLRPMLQDIADLAWIDDPALAPAIDAMVAHDLAFDALVRPAHLPHLLPFAERHRDLRIVIDHGGKPEIGAGCPDAWRRSLADLAALPHVACKLSGLLTEAGGRGVDAVRPWAKTLLSLFGPERLIWGSDWPVVTLASDYAGWLAFCRDLVPAAHHAAVFGGNAVRVYRLGPAAADR
ncbi:MAG: amidohydrolase family protein [Actinomycetospora chiangmaiensis]|nr:amidohydrolase family protein [Actinomycetospora chiangmaiensis]